MPEFYRPTFVEIKLSNIEYNLKKIKKLIGKRTKLMFVVKANAYGHGMEGVSNFAEKKGLCEFFGVSSIEEGIILRDIGIKKPILVLGSVYPLSNFPLFEKYDLIPTISSLIAAKEFEKYLRKNNLYSRCHIKLETGMNRIGISEKAFMPIADFILNSKNLKLDGIYSHFSSADTDRNYTLEQFEIYKRAILNLNSVLFLRHIANSYATINYPDTRLDMVRCGYAAYGYLSGFMPALSWKTRIVFLKSVKKNSYISYNKTYKTGKIARIATLPIGYGDGYLRDFSNKAYVLIRSKRCPVIGNVTMDMTMVDVSGIKDAKVGEEVVILGKSGNQNINLSQLANWADTIGYEITTLITKRVPKVFI